MTDVKASQIEVGSAGTMKVSLPCLTVGEGEPKVFLNFGLHGDEKTGLFVLKELLSGINLRRGTLRILVAANPLGQILNQRQEPLLKKDLNRSFPGDAKGDFAQRLAHRIISEGREYSDCVIDFHTLGMHTRLMALFMNQGSREVREKSLELIEAFGPELIWQLDTGSLRGRTWGGSLGPTLATEGIPNFAIEMTPLARARKEEILQTRDGLLRVFKHLGMVEKAPPPPTRKPLSFVYHPVKAGGSGLFEPRADLINSILQGELPEVEEGEEMGTLTELRTFKSEKILAETAGPVVALAGRKLVYAGSSLYQIGIEEPWEMIDQKIIDTVFSPYGKAMAPEKASSLENIERLARELAAEREADSSICQAAIWLLKLDENRGQNRRLARAFLASLPNLDEETKDWIADCLQPDSDSCVEAEVIQQAIQLHLQRGGEF